MPDASIRELVEDVPLTGTLEWIGRSRARRSAIEAVAEVELEVGTGVVGDHHAASGRGTRQVTIVQAEHLPVVASLLGRDAVAPDQTRRNLVVRGINVWALRALRLRIGDVLLEGTGPCPPCSRMNETLGPGGYHAMRGHGGITARVVKGGTVRVGDAVQASGADGDEP